MSYTSELGQFSRFFPADFSLWAQMWRAHVALMARLFRAFFALIVGWHGKAHRRGACALYNCSGHISPYQRRRKAAATKNRRHPTGIIDALVLSSFCPETAIFHNFGVNLQVCLCGERMFASAQPFYFLELSENISFPDQKLKKFSSWFPDENYL
jgi:hypothetical protein